MSSPRHEFNETQARIVREVESHSEPVVADTIKDAIDSVKRSAVDNQLRNLRKLGVIGVVDKRDTGGGGNPSNVYDLTDEGEREASRIDPFWEEEAEPVADAAGGADGEEVDRLRDQVRALQEKMQSAEEELDRRGDVIDEQQETIEQLRSRVDEMGSAVKNNKDRTVDLNSRVSDVGERVDELSREVEGPGR